MRLRVKDMTEGAVLAGSMAGRHLAGKLMEHAEEPRKPELCFVDFAGVDVATTSFLRESVIAFRDVIRGRRSNLYPVVANASPEVLEELEAILTARGDAMIICELKGNDRFSRGRLLGVLDPKQQLTYDLISDQGETDSGTLMRQQNDEGVGQTAWNNRLTALVAKGLVIEIAQGRTKRYRALI